MGLRFSSAPTCRMGKASVPTQVVRRVRNARTSCNQSLLHTAITLLQRSSALLIAPRPGVMFGEAVAFNPVRMAYSASRHNNSTMIHGWCLVYLSDGACSAFSIPIAVTCDASCLSLLHVRLVIFD